MKLQQQTTMFFRPVRLSPGDAPVELSFPVARIRMMLFIVLIVLVCIPSSLLAQTESYILHFGFDSSNLTTAHKEVLTQAMADFNPDQCTVDITGHTDTTGNLEYNRLLSEERAVSVRAFLTGQGVAATKTTIDFLGETHPVDPGAPEMNRRVEVRITCPESSSDIRDLFAMLAPPEETFTVNVDRDTVLVTEQGTLLYVRKNSFGIPPLVPDRNVKLLVRDRQKKSSLVLENITTVSPGGVVYTSQLMINIDARYQGYRPALKKEITVFSPADTISPGLRYLNGIAVGDDQHIEWNDPNVGRSPVYSYRTGFSSRRTMLLLPDTIELDTVFKSQHSFYRYNYPPCEFTCKICGWGVMYNTKMCKRLRAERDILKDSTLMMKTKVDSVVRYQIPRNEYIGRSRINARNRWTTTYKEVRIVSKKIVGYIEEIDTSMLRDAAGTGQEYYSFVANYGWSNLDWTYKIPDPVNFSVNIKPEKNTYLSVVFKKRRSIVPLYSNNEKYAYHSLPRGEAAWLIGMHYEDEQPSFALREIIITEEGIDHLDFEELSISELKERLKVMDM